MQKLKIQISPTITVEIEDDQPAELIRKAAFWCDIPQECPVCKSPLRLIYRNPQSFHYYGVACTGTPSHQVTFGQYKSGDGLFYKKDEVWTVSHGEQSTEDDRNIQHDRARQRTSTVRVRNSR